ncbi:uncharacterized protein BXZ73DRAFT_98518 [Epithele typhae]|uniref:uncharacterized protein n=1 Tax=Epithele typhae TaxID=378194 RepID=UPI002007CB20|nr:uncharacterized protein BXZ73DRAFT_98518 [Epithele typhae]KAH9941302.1 hypothetical protein BXZ73DRAFT_98518 [Epithele typhae]
MNPNAPSIPSPVEAACYYYGLPSKSELVARSSVEPWIEPWGIETYLDAKELKPVGPHDLDRVWEPTVASAIEAYLASQQVAWTSLDPARIGYVGGESFPVIIWVGVVPGSLSGAKGVEVALGCRSILTRSGVSDVHVEIRTSETSLQAKLHKPVFTSDPIVEAIEPFATTLGLPICGSDTPDVEGTGSFFFIDPKHPDKLFLLTARHVLFHPDTMTNEKHAPLEATKKVFLLSDAALQERIEAIKSKIWGKDALLTYLAARKLAVEGRNDEEAEKERACVEREEEDARGAIAALNEFLPNITRDWGSPADRAMGHVVLSPPLDFGVGPDQCTEDWAVVEIDRSRVDKANFVGNCIDLGTSICPGKFTLWMRPRSPDPTSFKYPGDRLLKFSGTIPDGEMGKPGNNTLVHDHEPDTMVIKRGGASGLTVGRLNTIRSVVRYCFQGEPGQPSREVAVYPRNSESGVFSKRGDSGSVVIDGTGRVAGILTGGAGTTDLRSDCTYVTSINFLVKRLQANGYNPNIFPTAADL